MNSIIVSPTIGRWRKKILMNGLNKRLDDFKGKWTDKLDNVLWAIQTTPKKTTGENPFGLVYDYEVIAPIEIAVTSH